MAQTVYDESFHKGVNIIRGENSSGKSTIANFIFYILGGFFNNWTTEASKVHRYLLKLI
ncbi:AAA family ATPase [Mucilaginibacter sp. S1162]|uniref:AAA family ATPase n=1 Tax=Mucilaginibacter humi TaxID=2732510 RepID=A0ABX1W6H1_9SPHI|nr:ATP-binding protein [Mucilaginibacter humi]NNU33697.1 AAA family ATPase [Mucilaginibacter humi]